jgi:hypothetical protein
LERFLQYPLDKVAEDYLARRGLDGVASSLRFGRVSADLPREHPHRMYAGRLVIPSFSARGTVTDLAFRCIGDHADCGAAGHAKYLFPKGSNKGLYNVGAVQSPSSTIHVLEGQLNAATLVAAGEAAVGCTGADAWKSHYWRLFQGFERVIVWQDGDDKEPKPGPDGKVRPKGGDIFVSKVRAGIPQAEVVECPAGYDANTYYVEHGKDALLRLVHDESYDGSDEDEVLDAEEGEDFDPFAGEHFDEDGERIPF